MSLLTYLNYLFKMNCVLKGSEEYFPNKWKKFPKFGASPTSDPSRTPSPPETPKPEVVKEEKSEEVLKEIN